MKKILLFTALIMLSALAMAQNAKKVAILETVDKENKVEYGVELQLRGYLTDAINRTPGYEGYDRVDMASILGEHNFQRTGYVSDAQIKKLGEMTGASSIIVAEAAMYGSDRIIIIAKIIDVETARIENTARPKVASTSDDSMAKACAELAAELLSNNMNFVQQSLNKTITVNGVSFTMIFVKGGTFVIGCTEEQGENCLEDCNGWGWDCRPYQETVSDFYIGETEVTQALWRAVMGSEPTDDGGWKTEYGRGDDYPAYSVGGTDVNTFIERLNNMTGLKFRFSTFVEWEYAARGGNKNKHYKYSGSNYIDEVAWYKGNSNDKTHPVKMKKPNELGIYDMTGNVYELNEFEGIYGLGYTSRGGCFRSGSDETIVTAFYPIASIGEYESEYSYVVEGPGSSWLCGLRLVLDIK